MEHSSVPGRSGGGRLSRWLFAPVDPTCTAVFRVLLSLMLIVVFWPRHLALDAPFRDIAAGSRDSTSPSF